MRQEIQKALQNIERIQNDPALSLDDEAQLVTNMIYWLRKAERDINFEIIKRDNEKR